MTDEQFSPIDLDVEATRKRWMKDPQFADAYNALEDEYAALGGVAARAPAGGHDTG